MKCSLKRYYVTNIMGFLVVTMIMVNLYVLALAIGGKATQEVSKNQLEKKKEQVIFSPDIPSYRFVVAVDGSIRTHSHVNLNSSPILSILYAIKRKFNQLKEENVTSLSYINVINEIKRALSLSTSTKGQINASSIWRTAADWPFCTDKFLYQSLGDIMKYANRAKIVQAKNSKRGTQLKVEVVLEGGQLALFKPAWYPHGITISGATYGGKDRHFGEIAAFYLSQILGYNSAPITVGRSVNLSREIFDFASDQLKKTFSYKEENMCFYGVCYYCHPDDPVCAQGTNIDGALILLLDKKLRIVANPWRRTYKENMYAAWETDATFCSGVLKDSNPIKRNEAILDVVAVAIFDFLIGNADRHHFEMYADVKDNIPYKSHSGNIFLIDNGKSFGNFQEDYIDILAPLYQCCKIRKSLYVTLNKFRGVLGKSLNVVSSFDPLYPLLPSNHMHAIDRRLIIVLAAVQVCLDTFPRQQVIF